MMASPLGIELNNEEYFQHARFWESSLRKIISINISLNSEHWWDQAYSRSLEATGENMKASLLEIKVNNE